MSNFKIINRLLKLIGKFINVLILAVVNGAVGFLCGSAITILGAVGLAKMLGSPINMSYELIVGLIIASGILRGILRYFEQYSNHYIAFKILAIIRHHVYNALKRLAPAKLDTKQKGDIISTVTSDIEMLEVFYAHTMSPVLIAIITQVTILLFIGFISSWYLALVALFGYIFLGIIVPKIASNKLNEDGLNYRNKLGSFNAYYLDSIKGIKEISLNNQNEERLEKVNTKSEELISYTTKLNKGISKNEALQTLMVSFFTLISFLVGILLVRFNNLDIGLMIIGVVAVMGSFGPVLALADLPRSLNQTFASAKRVFAILDEEPVVNKNLLGNEFEYENLEVENLYFKYLDETPYVIKNLSFQVNNKNIVGIIGPSGSGKSTLLKLLIRIWPSEKGEITYNNLNIESIKTESLLNNVTMISQSTYLFNDTILNNLLMSNPSATLDEVYEASKKASIHDFIMTLENGYNHIIINNGDNISSGQKQRIGLARAFLRKSNIILLDEPTSNVDAINEGIILKSLSINRDETIILVSHRKSTMNICDTIYSFENGRLVLLNE
ncbi:MAG: amino acid ABC transporter ATP-binding/permease protein [Acholeplasmataceae bacterium]|jgi:ATP-binding cassette subfamily C protein